MLNELLLSQNTTVWKLTGILGYTCLKFGFTC